MCERRGVPERARSRVAAVSAGLFLRSLRSAGGWASVHSGRLRLRIPRAMRPFLERRLAEIAVESLVAELSKGSLTHSARPCKCQGCGRRFYNDALLTPGGGPTCKLCDGTYPPGSLP